MLYYWSLIENYTTHGCTHSFHRSTSVCVCLVTVSPVLHLEAYFFVSVYVTVLRKMGDRQEIYLLSSCQNENHFFSKISLTNSIFSKDCHVFSTTVLLVYQRRRRLSLTQKRTESFYVHYVYTYIYIYIYNDTSAYEWPC